MNNFLWTIKKYHLKELSMLVDVFLSKIQFKSKTFRDLITENTFVNNQFSDEKITGYFLLRKISFFFLQIAIL